MARNNTLTYRVEQLENAFDKLDGKMDILMTNELPHIKEEIASIKTRQNVVAAINIGAILLVGLAAKYL